MNETDISISNSNTDPTAGFTTDGAKNDAGDHVDGDQNDVGNSAANAPTSEAPTQPAKGGRIGRRSILAGLGAGGVFVGTPALAAAAGRRRRGEGPPAGPTGTGRPAGGGRDANGRDGGRRRGGEDAMPDSFSRLFRDEAPFEEANDELRTALQEIGRPGGMMDANDPLEVGPIRLITEPELSPANRDNPTHTAGATFMGQFIDHDITRDAGSSLGRPQSIRRSMNLRSARLDLDSVYGGGPPESPELYRSDDMLAFRVESGGRFEDLPRDLDGVAIIADGRNDENMMISGLQVSFLLAHNAILERVRAATSGDPAASGIFAETQRQLRWHYQWVVLREILPQFVGAAMVEDILQNGPKFYTPATAQIPVEFQTSAYRFGHSMIRPSYRANLAGMDGEPFFGMVFDPTQFGVENDPDDLNGGFRAPRRFIGWQTFFDFGDGEVKPNKRIDTKISTPLFQLPLGAIGTTRGEPIGPASLASRNLLRHITWGIPSGQQVASTMGESVLSSSDLSDIGDVMPALGRSTPLWFYVLREADVMADGLHLGPVGGRIVAEVLIGLLRLDPTSFLSADPTWRPTLPSKESGQFGMADLLTVAGVDPASRGE